MTDPITNAPNVDDPRGAVRHASTPATTPGPRPTRRTTWPAGLAPAIRPVTAADVPALKAVIGGTDLFPPELLDGMLAGVLSGEAPDELFARTRAFYRGIGYDEEARIREFYAAGDDKVVFRKALGGARG